MPDQTANGSPAPCTEVTADWAVLKDINGATQFLLIPTAKTTGIEDPALLQPGTPNYFAAAWSARRFVEQRAGHALPRDVIGLAINAEGARSQEQFHIHVDCIRPDVREALRTLPIGAGWAPLPRSLVGQQFVAMRLPGDDLTANPFDLLADGIPGAKQAMGRYTIAVVGEPGGFILLVGERGSGEGGHGEDIQDHSCALAGSSD